MPGRPVITLTTDFGYDDPFVGVMKGAILRINPDAEIVDITHGISPQDIQEAAFTIGMNYRYFPDDTIHVVVVDPGVGSARRPLLVFSENHYFVGPDNGVFSYIYRVKHETLDVRHITAEHYFLQKQSPTFQGRDLFAPVAAWFSRGVRIEKFGESISDYKTVDLPFSEVSGDGELKGRIIHIDRFGNAISNIGKTDIESLDEKAGGRPLKVYLKETEVRIRNFYHEAADGDLCALVNSSGFIEFFVSGGKAAVEHGISVGDEAKVVVD